MKKFVIGDVHGRIEALKEVLKKSKFDYDKDKLIVLGDVCDGGYNTYEVIEELLKIKNLVLVLGNHDLWLLQHIKNGWAGELWLQQGGANTLRSYGGEVERAPWFLDNHIVKTSDINIPVTHQEFLNRGVYYHEEDNMVFVHGGFNPNIPIEDNDLNTLIWDRSLIERCKNGRKLKWDKVFVGHTTTQSIKRAGFESTCLECGYEKDETIKKCFKCKSSNIQVSRGKTSPIIFNNLYCLDCGAGWDGRLCLYNIDNNKYFLSKIQRRAR